MKIETDSKFAEFNLPCNELKCICTRKIKKPIIQFEITKKSMKFQPVVVGWTKIGMLSDFLGTPKMEMRQLVLDKNAKGINKLLKESDKKIKILASKYNDTWYIYNIATEKFFLIKFSHIRNLLKKEKELVALQEKKFNESLVWENRFAQFKACEGEDFKVMLRITSGRNTKKTAIKVIVYVKVGSCDNTLTPVQYASIKHTKNWREQLLKQLKKAYKTIAGIKEVIETAGKIPISIEEGYQIIEGLKLNIRDEQVISKAKKALKRLFDKEFKTNKSRFALSQAMSFLGTHAKEGELNPSTLSYLQTQAYEVLIPNQSIVM